MKNSLVVSNMPIDIEESTLEFWNGTAEEYKAFIEKQLDDNNIKDFWIRTIILNSPRKKHLRILDIGTGPGFFTINLTKLGHDVIGIDVGKEMIRVAKENAEVCGVDCKFMVMNANDLQFEDNSFDVIINRNVTWTLPDLFECYREWRRVLDSDGKLIIFDANHYKNVFDDYELRKLCLRTREHVMQDQTPYSDYFDFHVRWSYWEELPMVGTPRPEWDRNMLIKLRYLDTEVQYNICGDNKDSDKNIGMFMVTARKPSLAEENDYFVREYWNGIAGCVSGRTVRLLDDQRGERLADSIKSYLEGCHSVLDVGAASGILSIPLAKRGYDVTAIDWSWTMAEMLGITCEQFGATVKSVVGDARKMDFSDGSFDCVVIRNVIWNSYEPEALLRESVRVLKKGGVLIIIDGNWMANIKDWESANEDRKDFPNAKKRDLGLGARDVINQYYARLPLNDAFRPSWDEDMLKGMGMEITECSEFDDPAITEDLKPVLKKGFIVVSRK